MVAPLVALASGLVQAQTGGVLPFDFWDFALKIGLPQALMLGMLWLIVQGKVAMPREVTAKETEIVRLVAKHDADMATLRADHESDRKDWASQRAELIAQYESRLSRMDAGMSRLESMLFQLVGLTKDAVGQSASAASSVPTEARRGP